MVDLLQNFKDLRNGDLEYVDNTSLFSLLRWCSGSKIDLKWTTEVNKLFFSVDRDIIKAMLCLGLADNSRFIKYPRAAAQSEDKNFELRKQLVKEYYGWSKQEFDRNATVIGFVDFEAVAEGLGSDDGVRKKIGLKVMKPAKKVKEKAVKPAGKDVFDFD